MRSRQSPILRDPVPEAGYCWTVELPGDVPDGDSLEHPMRSLLCLFENQLEIGPPHALHDEIRKLGGGRFSHWGRSLYFSTSDNSSPLLNGKIYSALVKEQDENDLKVVRTKPVNFQKLSPEKLSDDVNYALQISKGHLELVSHYGQRLEGLRVLELGPGINFAPQLVMASLGARVSVADRFLVPWDNDYHPPFYRAFRAAWNAPLPAVDQVLNDGAHSPEVIASFASPAENLAGIAPATFDLVISNAVLEHVYSLPAVCREMGRVTAPGGLNMHQIDFRDHHDFDRPLEFLIVPDDEFALEFEHINGDHGNRLRSSEARLLFEKNGFELVDFEVNLRCEQRYLEEFLPRLRASVSRYRDWPRDDLLIICGRLVYRKS
jgi:SAM-dependent methyltransferase